MSQLNLSPNPTIFIVQAGVFLGTMFTVKKLFLEPYLQLRKRRAEQTTGKQDEVLRLNQEASEMIKTIDKRTVAAGQASQARVEEARQSALQQRDGILGAARQKANQEFEDFEKKLKVELSAEQAKAPSIVKDLAEKIYQELLN